MHFLGDYSSALPGVTKTDLFAYRYQVFVEQLGWDLNTPEGIEVDEFDHDDTFYVIANDNHDNITGCARLLPTTQPYLLEKVFPELLNGLSAPKSEKTWELSRFTSFSTAEIASQQKGQLSSSQTSALLKESIKFAKQQGAEQLISVSPIAVERLLRSLKIKSHRAGPAQTIDGHTLIACWIDLTQTDY